MPVHDISTDTDTPPAFVDVLPLRRWALNPPGYRGQRAAALQRRLYGDVQPLVVAGPLGPVHAAVRDLMHAAGWHVVGDAEADGRLEAVAITPWLRFRDDVVVRLTPQPDGRIRVDMRSASRVGRNDFGVNARRVRTFLAQLAGRLSRP